MENNYLHGWIPYKITITDGQAECHWINSCNQRYTEPFFDETIGKIKSINYRRVSRNSVSSLQMLEEWADQIEYIAPTAFVFHVSRCGSTLLSQLLGLSDENIALSEVPIFDDILRLRYKVPQIDEAYTSRLLRAAMQFYGQKRTGIEKRLFIKTDSWHVHFHQQLRAMYPETPFILLYRTPNEVFKSHVKQRGIQVVPGLIEPEVFGFSDCDTLSLDDYLARVLASYFSAYLEIVSNDQLTLLVNYNEGIITIMEKMASFTNIHINDTTKQKMKERTNYHSKHPEQVFSETREITVPEFLNEAFGLYHQVEEKRAELIRR
ncbi:hypothetical protein ACFGVR_13385 [Mucilaginibacter sp. AW1-3]